MRAKVKYNFQFWSVWLLVMTIFFVRASYPELPNFWSWENLGVVIAMSWISLIVSSVIVFIWNSIIRFIVKNPESINTNSINSVPVVEKVPIKLRIEIWKLKCSLTRYLILTGFKYKSTYDKFDYFITVTRKTYIKDDLCVEIRCISSNKSKNISYIKASSPKFGSIDEQCINNKSISDVLVFVKRVFPDDIQKPYNFYLLPNVFMIISLLGYLLASYVFFSVLIHLSDIYQGKNSLKQDIFTAGFVGIYGLVLCIILTKSYFTKFLLVVGWLIVLSVAIVWMINRQ
jgi:hypothetical protein